MEQKKKSQNSNIGTRIYHVLKTFEDVQYGKDGLLKNSIETTVGNNLKLEPYLNSYI